MKINLALAKFYIDLKLSRLSDLNLQILNITDNLFVSSNNNHKTNVLISNGTCGAIARNRNLAILKGLVERIERQAMHESGAHSSTGFAAYPVFFSRKKSERYARKFAYLEAIERFVWRNWWENRSIKYSLRPISQENSDILFHVKKFMSITNAYMIIPRFNETNIVMGICCFETDNGVILGGAARESYNDMEFKALSEVFFHSIAVNRYEKHQVELQSDYERRLIFLSENKDFFTDRLQVNGQDFINIPTPLVDSKILHSCDHFCSVHRILFDFESNINSNCQLGYI